MSRILNVVVREQWAPNVNVVCVHRREFGGYADACLIDFVVNHPTDPVSVSVIKRDPHLRELVAEHVAKQNKPALICSEETAPT